MTAERERERERDLCLCTYCRLPSPWGYQCVNNTCVKKLADGTLPLATLNECKLTCGKMGVLWPQPTSVSLASGVVYFLPSNVVLQPSCSGEACSLLQEAFAVFRDNLERNHPLYNNGKAPWMQPWQPDAMAHSLVVKVCVCVCVCPIRVCH